MVDIGGLVRVIYLSEKWDYTIKTDDTPSKSREIYYIKSFTPKLKLSEEIVIGNIYRPNHN